MADAAVCLSQHHNQCQQCHPRSAADANNNNVTCGLLAERISFTLLNEHIF